MREMVISMIRIADHAPSCALPRRTLTAKPHYSLYGGILSSQSILASSRDWPKNRLSLSSRTWFLMSHGSLSPLMVLLLIALNSPLSSKLLTIIIGCDWNLITLGTYLMRKTLNYWIKFLNSSYPICTMPSYRLRTACTWSFPMLMALNGMMPLRMILEDAFLKSETRNLGWITSTSTSKGLRSQVCRRELPSETPGDLSCMPIFI